MNEKSDAIVVGGGPCGSFSALTMARKGMDVTVCEEHKEIGIPAHCAGHLSLSGLRRLGLQLPSRIIQNKLKGVVFWSPRGNHLSVGFNAPVTCVVDRELLDKYLYNLALRAGVQFLLGSKVESLLVESSYVTGVEIKSGNTKQTLRSGVVVDAEGCPSRLLRQMGMQATNRTMTVNAVLAEVEEVNELDMDTVEVYLGRRYAPGFFAWIIPTKEDTAKIGLATTVGNPQKYLQRFIQKHPVASKKLWRSKIVHQTFHPISLGGAIPRTYANGLLVVGDVASQVKATTGGGVIFGLLCSRIAGRVAYEASQRDDYSESTLSRYESMWKREIGLDLTVMLHLRRLLNQLSDSEIDRIIDFGVRLATRNILRQAGDLDFQGRSLMRMMLHPSILIPVTYFVASAFLSSLRR
ncbi:MAG: NAD(P)/FAD-dependent oxidoreductase [Candidatus Bathyarchaeota archaeon]|nr:MAG: NAD(P)/FAD-dependent oxidoreductase [Candidatus Bathyarchaeota archaeon]